MDSLAGGGENRVHNRGRNWRHRRLAHSEGFRRLARNDVHCDYRRIAHPGHTVIGIACLLHRAFAKCDLAHERGRNSPDNSTFDLLFDTSWIDDEATVYRCHHPLYPHFSRLVHCYIHDISDVSLTIVNVASQTAPVPGGASPRTPARFFAHCLKYPSQTPSIKR